MEDFVAAHVTRTGLLQLSAAPEEVFPLFGPIEEKRWEAGWDPEVVHPRSSIAAPGMVFRTRHEGEAATVWLLNRWDPESGEIEYLTVTPDLRVGRIELRLQEEPPGRTRVRVSYTFTALSLAGNACVEDFTEARYAERMRRWEAAIDEVLRRRARVTTGGTQSQVTGRGSRRDRATARITPARARSASPRGP